jgi:hypothetical protein
VTAEVIYCEHEDLYRLGGLPRGVLAEQARPVASVDLTANTLELADHGLSLDDPVQLTVEAGGTLPQPLAAGTTYYAKPVAGRQDLLQLATGAGGSAVNITVAGVGAFSVLFDDSAAKSEAARRYGSSQVDQYCVAHGVPFERNADGDYPSQVVAYSAKLAVLELCRLAGTIPPHIETAAMGVLADLSKWQVNGVPFRRATTTPATNLAIRGTSTGSDPRGWAPLGSGVLR